MSAGRANENDNKPRHRYNLEDYENDNKNEAIEERRTDVWKTFMTSTCEYTKKWR